ncbi:MAG: phosphotransferase family protein [Anaerolineae bacterium]|nr:phosphotransferase family protein [Anaerolineae bacterium]NUQ07236.1 phosphotransferase family protein [Anaerolineae bacterium]
MRYPDLALPEALARLAEFIGGASGDSCTIERAAPLAGGASRDMWLIDAVIGVVREHLVLRRDLPTSMVESALSREHEFHLMRVAHAAGVRVARPRWLCADPEILGGPFFLMDYVQGVSIGRKVVAAPDLAQARAALPGQMAGELAKIHHLPVDSLDFLAHPGRTPALDAIAQTYAILDALNVRNPALEFALRFAERHAPLPEAITFIHGDFRIGNLIVHHDGLAAIADWEFAHLGDPDEELGYLCMRDWRFGGAARVGGIADREPFLRAYEAAGGRTVDRRAVDFWELLGNIRWGVICLSQANRHLSGLDPSVELASLGRRSAEMQYEALRLIRMMETT